MQGFIITSEEYLVNPTILTNFPDINTTVPPPLPKENIQTWIVNDIAIHLIKEQNLLKYETINSSGEKLQTNTIPLPPDSNFNEVIDDLKKCKALLDTDGAPIFVERYKRWEVDNQEIDLVHGHQDLLWLIYCKSTKKTSVFTIKEATIPSTQCHCTTINLIEKIKSNALTITHVRHLQKDFTVTRIIEEKEIQSEQLKFHYDQRRDGIDSERHLNNMYREGLGVGLFAGYAGLSASWSSICAATSAVSASLGGGAVGGAIAGSCVGLPLTLGAGVVLPIAAAAGYISYSFLKTNPPRRTNIETERRIDMMLPRKPLFVEIEPISILSRIDPNVRVSKFIWAVSLITHGGASNNHAQIVVEGINDGFYNSESTRSSHTKEVSIGEKFIHISDFNPPVRSRLFSPEKFSFATRTEIWLKTSSDVQKMLKAIQKEQESNVAFNIKGIDSFLPTLPLEQVGSVSKCVEKLKEDRLLFGNQGHNCFTWARDKLKIIDVELGKSVIGFVITLPMTYTKLQEEYLNEIPRQFL